MNGFPAKVIIDAFSDVQGCAVAWDEDASRLRVSSEKLSPASKDYVDKLHAGDVDALWHQHKLHENNLNDSSLYPFVICLSHLLHYSVEFDDKPWPPLFAGFL